MDKKVYEGYKKTASSGNQATKPKAKSTVTAKTKSTVSKPKSSTPKSVNAKSAGKTTVTKPRIAMFIDVDNVGISRENLLEILFYVNGKYQIDLCKLYGFSEETLPGIREIATEYNLVTVGKMKFKQVGTNCLDSRLLIDAYECAINNKQKIDLIFLWCYPCDLADLFEKMIALGVNTAIIDNPIFDCKNKFVSKTFKLYSPYNFNSEQPMYGKVQNVASNIAPNENVEPTSNNTVTAAPVTETAKSNNDTEAAAQPTMIDGVVPPVLPRRSIPERSNPNAPKPQTTAETAPETDSTVTDGASSGSLVDEIARKLNLPIPSAEDAKGTEDAEQPTEQRLTPEMFRDMLKRTSFGDLLDGEKDLKYEDTIGDL